MENEMMDKPIVLYVDDELDNLVVFKSAFRRYYDVIAVSSAAEALEIFSNSPISIIITDQRMPDMTGMELISVLPDEPEAIRMVLTGYSDVEAIVAAINSGKVYKYITKPWDKNDLKVTIDKAIETLYLKLNNKSLIKELKEANESLERKVIERTQEIQHQKEEIESQKIQLQEEKDRSDNLLLNILPSEIAEELKLTGKAKTRHYDEVAVMFCDFIDFTGTAESLEPSEVVSELDQCFQAFDEIIEKYGLEKIKTIGDAYMCAGGLLIPDVYGSHKVVLAALEIQRFLERLKNEAPGFHLYNIRIGIHTGPVIAGVVGRKKFAYDLWGDTVNIASRMESSGMAGRINISKATYQLVKDKFLCFHRGKVMAKGKGEMDMYFVEKELEEIREIIS